MIRYDPSLKKLVLVGHGESHMCVQTTEKTDSKAVLGVTTPSVPDLMSMLIMYFHPQPYILTHTGMETRRTRADGTTSGQLPE